MLLLSMKKFLKQESQKLVSQRLIDFDSLVFFEHTLHLKKVNNYNNNNNNNKNHNKGELQLKMLQ